MSICRNIFIIRKQKYEDPSPLYDFTAANLCDWERERQEIVPDNTGYEV